MLLRVLQQNELPKIDAFNNAHDYYGTIWQLSLNRTTKMNFFSLIFKFLVSCKHEYRSHIRKRTQHSRRQGCTYLK